MPKHPNVIVRLAKPSSPSSNAFAIIANVERAMLDAKVPKPEVDAYVQTAMSGDFENLMQVTHEMVTII
jgi:hypothetical protein